MLRRELWYQGMSPLYRLRGYPWVCGSSEHDPNLHSRDMYSESLSTELLHKLPAQPDTRVRAHLHHR